MRTRVAVLLAVTCCACATKHLDPIEPRSFVSGELSAVLRQVSTWDLTAGSEHAEVDFNEFGEGITLALVGTQIQLWANFCGPSEAQHRDAFRRVVDSAGLRCTWYVSENLVGCREGLICIDVHSIEELSQLGGTVADRVFTVKGEQVVRYRVF